MTDLMEPTRQTFYDALYATECEVWVDDIGTYADNRQTLILNETICYPQGGGQRGDRGGLSIPLEIVARSGLPARLEIIDTRKKDGVIHHLLKDRFDVETLRQNVVGTQKLRLELSWQYRYTQMKLHSTAHLLHCFMEKVLTRELPHPNLSDLQDARGVNRYDQNELLSVDQLTRAIQQLNEFNAAGHPIRLFPDENPGRPNWARLWQCENWTIPCGGLHPQNTREIGPVMAEISFKKQQTTVSFGLAA